jgi:release factor glutamine methyltransferase
VEDFKKFYLDHQTLLENNYPGINPQIFEREVLDILKLGLSRQTIEKELLSGKPFQYILGSAEFYRLKFFVNNKTLIPRSETELLIEKALRFITPEMSYFADVGTGSGCIGLSILNERKNLSAMFIDISSEALDVAKMNAENLNLNDRVEFFKSDRLSEIKNKKFDFIVSNPPYIKRIADKSSVHEKVIEFEPEIALFLNDEEYDEWFIEFFLQVQRCLNKKGFFLMEGHEDHLERLKKLCPFSFVEILKDYTLRDRFLYAHN